MLLSIEKGLSVNDIELHMTALLIEISPYKRHKAFETAFAFKCRRMEFHIEQGPV